MKLENEATECIFTRGKFCFALKKMHVYKNIDVYTIFNI